MPSVRRILLLLALPLLAVGALACGSDGDDGPGAIAPEGTAPGVEAATAALAEGRTVIDVRTPEEYDEGHIEGAERIGLADPDFDEKVADLDPDGRYIVYCRTGNRSAEAATAMREAGLDVVDGGAMSDMEAAGWPTAISQGAPVPSSVS